MMRSRSPRSPRGMAIMTCLILIGFIGIAVAAMGTHMAAEMKRTKQAAADAQVRQLLTFAQLDLQQRLQALVAKPADNNAGNDAGKKPEAMEDPVEFVLPRELVSDLASGTATRVEKAEGFRQFRITASLGPRSATQVIQFRFVDGRWALQAARIEPRAW